MRSNFYLLILLVIVAAVFLIWFLGGRSVTGQPGPGDGGQGVVCTMEAKLCPDGSYVGRQGPDCEFAPCP